MVRTFLPLDDIFEWDVANWSKCLPYWEPWLTRLDKDTARILALGERDGGLSLWFALQGFKVLCTDYHIPGELARLSHERWMVQDRIPMLPWMHSTYRILRIILMLSHASLLSVASCCSAKCLRPAHWRITGWRWRKSDGFSSLVAFSSGLKILREPKSINFCAG